MSHHRQTPMRVKICGITTAEAAHQAGECGADDLGFVFFERSPRHLSLRAAADLAPLLPQGPQRIGVMVNPDLGALTAFAKALALDAIQLHGSELPEFIIEVKGLGLKVIKAIPIADAQDFDKTIPFEGLVDGFLFDAKPTSEHFLPGGNAHSFSWGLTRFYKGNTPFYLAGGLTPQNVRVAIAQSGARALDVSSGVESKPGIKSPSAIEAFIRAAKGAKSSNQS